MTDLGDKAKAALDAHRAKAEAKREEKRKRTRRTRQTNAPAAIVARVYHAPDMLRIAYMAGEGRSAGEIATAIGGTTRFRICALLSKVGLSLLRRRHSERVVRISVDRKLFDRIVEEAVARDVDPLFVAGRLLDAVADEPVLLRNLIDDMEH